MTRFILQFVCLLLIPPERTSLPFSDVGLRATPLDIWKRDNISQPDQGRLLQENDGSLRANVCPLWEWDPDVKCTDNHGVFLSVGHCLTYKEGKGAYEFKCFYFQLEGHKVSDYEPGYIKLPDNISELNDYMCGPMNREGFLCEECIDGFSVSMTSLGHKCSNCTDVWYGIPFYLVIELVPITAFYLLLLALQIYLTSAPMTSFILYSQTVMFVIAIDRPPPFDKVVPQYEKSFLLNLNLFFYGPWNLDFIRYILPPFCVTNGINLRHQALLGYVSILYPLILIFLTWVCIELHGRNIRLIVYLLVPFRKCLGKLKQDWSEKLDLVGLFSAFFLLSYSRLMFQASLFLVRGNVTRINANIDWSMHAILVYASNITCGSSKYFAIAIVSVLILFVFNVLPALLLVLYPFKFIRSCLTKCRLDTLCLSAFMDKFHGCYRNGLNGGKDMRSFAGVYFFVRFLPFFYYPCQLYKIPFSFGSYLVLIFLSATLLIAIARPYKENYMNVFDTLLLGHLTFMSKILTDNYYDGMGTHIFIINLIPVFALMICLLCVKVFKVHNLRCACCRRGRPETNENPRLVDDPDISVLESMDRVRSEIQPLLASTSDSAAATNNNSRKYESIGWTTT